MECEISRLQNLSDEYVYHVDNHTVHFSFFLDSLLMYVDRQFKKHFLYAESFMLRYLQNHHTPTITLQEMSDLTAHLHIPVIYAYVFICGFILSILAIPIVWSLGRCTKRKIDVSKYQCCFPIEILFFVLFAICLLSGIISSFQIAVSVHDSLTIFPLMWRNMMQDLNTNTNVFKKQVRTLGEVINSTSNSVQTEISMLPKNVTRLLTNDLNSNAETFSLEFANDFMEIKSILEMSFITTNKSATKHVVETTIREFHTNVWNILNGLQTNTVSNDSVILIQELKFKWRNMLNADLKFPNWQIVHNDLLMIFLESLPEISKSFYFEKNLLNIITNYSVEELNKIRNSIRKLQELSTAVERNITHMIRTLFPRTVQEIIRNGTYAIDDYLSAFQLTSTNQSRITSGNFWIMMLPSFYTLLVWILFFVTFVCATKELKKIVTTGTSPIPSRNTTCVLWLFQITVIFSTTFLWMVFLLTILFYCIYLPGAVLCEAINDKRIFSDYIDKPHVWNNKTWLDNKLQDYLPEHRHPLEIGSILEKCYHNNTIYMSLGMDEYWNVDRCVNDFNVNIDVLQTIVGNAIRKITTPDLAMRALFKKIARVEKNLDLHFAPVIERHIESFRYEIYGKLFKELEAANALKIKNNSLSDANMNSLHVVNNTISFILGNISKVIELKYDLKNMLDKFYSIDKDLQNCSVILENRSVTVVPGFLNSSASNINYKMAEIKKIVKMGTEKYIGNCYILPFIYDKITWSICGYGLPLVTGAWVSLAVISFSITVCIILSCRISGYIRGFSYPTSPWRRLENQRYSSQTSRLNGSVAFDKEGIMGNSVNIVQ